MLNWRILAQVIGIGLMAVLPAGCGVIPMVAQQTTSAALAPFTTAAQAAGTDLQILGRGISYMTTQTVASTRQITSSLNNTALTTQATASQIMPNPVSYQMPPTASPSYANPSYSNNGSSNKPGKANDKNKTANLDILPADVLVRLTKDQAGLQKAAQSEAMTAPVGETVFWHLDGREGTAVTQSENLMGGFTCRTFEQTIALEDYFDKASVTACHTERSAWTRSF